MVLVMRVRFLAERSCGYSVKQMRKKNQLIQSSGLLYHSHTQAHTHTTQKYTHTFAQHNTYTHTDILRPKHTDGQTGRQTKTHTHTHTDQSTHTHRLKHNTQIHSSTTHIHHVFECRFKHHTHTQTHTHHHKHIHTPPHRRHKTTAVDRRRPHPASG